MPDQLDIPFNAPNARWSDPETAHRAAKDVTFKASEGRVLALTTLRSRGPLTDFELARYTGWLQTSIGKRRHECMVAGLVEAATSPEGTPLRRPSRFGGSLAQVWRLTAAGVRYLDARPT